MSEYKSDRNKSKCKLYFFFFVTGVINALRINIEEAINHMHERIETASVNLC